MVIVGLGGQTKDALTDLVASYSENDLWFYTDFENDSSLKFFKEHGLNILVGKEKLKAHFSKGNNDFIAFIGNNIAREKVVKDLKELGGNPTCFISQSAHINLQLLKLNTTNTIVMDGAHLSASVEIGEGSIVYINAAVAHDSVVGKYVFVSAYSGISSSFVDDYTFVGINSMIGPKVHIGKHCVIGANSYVKENVKDGAIVAGSPAKIIGYKDGFGE
ncbi:MAG: hypothetical protein M9931_07805 [Chitinophagales bacterium]|nr:hypothetical protein [Chitinophagales bacterium]